MSRLLPLAAVCALLAAASAAAHPLLTIRYDRTVAVRLGPDAVRVKYSLEANHLSVIRHAAQIKPFGTAGPGEGGKTVRELYRAYAEKLAPEIARDLRATADGTRLTFAVEKIDIDAGEHPRFRFEFRATWPPGPAKREFTFEDDSLREPESHQSMPGVIALTLERAGGPDTGVKLDNLVEPDEGMRLKPAIDLPPDADRLLRRASATVELPRAIADASAAKNPGADPPASPPAPQVTVEEPAERPSLAADLAARGLPALFDSSYGLGVLLLAAFLFGSAHAFTPGHGKTLVAAYLVGERGTVGHAVLLAVATTVAHTGSVLVVAGVLYGVYGNEVPGATQGVLQFLGGLLVAAVGAWLLMRRLTGQADHVHLFGGHHHHHGDGHHHHHHGHDHHHHHHHGPTPESAKTTFGWARLVLMGLGGGLIPCWDAVLLLLAAVALNRVGAALPLLLAFSLGLGAVLVLLGVSVVYAHRAGAARFAESRWFQVLPMVSAALLLGTGLWLCREGVKAATG
jgi:ABC-type nickel/cobalt efflux system permease component RcnA